MKKSYVIACLLMLIGINFSMVAQSDPGTENLKHKWTFDEDNANDIIGTLNGTLVDGATVADGVLNTLNGGIVELDAAALAINTYTELTVEAWFTAAAGINNGYHFLYYFGNSDGNGNHFTGYTPSRGDDRSRAIIDTGKGEMGVNGAEYNEGKIHHMVCVINSTTLYYYIDGILASSTSIGESTLADVGTQFAWFCRGGWAGDASWRGTIDEISVYNKALTIDNVKYLYDLKKADIPAEDPGTANLTHQWTFDDGTADDNIGSVDGLLEGAATITNKALDTRTGGFVSLDAAVLDVKSYTELTVEAWFTASAGVNGGYRFLYYFGNSDGNGNHFVGYTPVRGNGVSRTMMDTGTGDKGVNATRYDDDRLHHAVCVVDATTLSYYMDGILLNSTPISDATLANVGNQFAWFCKGGWPDPTWQGFIHKISMYNKALTANNVKYLYGIGAEESATITSTVTGLAFDPNYSVQTMSVTSLNLSSDIQIEAPAGITVSPSTITANATAVSVTVTFDNSTAVDGNIVLTSGVTVLSIPVKSADESCFTKLYSDKTNIITDYGCNSLSNFPGGWGNKELHSIISDAANVYCGANSIAVGDGTNNGGGSGSLNFGLTGKVNPNSTYHVRAMIKTEGGGFQFGVAGWESGQGDKVFPVESNDWTSFDFKFTTGETLSNPVIFLNNWQTTGLKAYIDNYEMYEVPNDVTGVNNVGNMNQRVFVNNDQIVVEFESKVSEQAQIEVYNLQGLLLSNVLFNSQNGVNRKTITANYPEGVYIVRLTVGGQSSFAKIMK